MTTPDRLVGVEHAQAEVAGPIIVRDGLGNEISIAQGESKAFSVKLDADRCFYWRCRDPERYEGFPVIERCMARSGEANYIQVTRDAGRAITFACYERQPPALSPVPTSEARLFGSSPVAEASPVQASSAGPPPDWGIGQTALLAGAVTAAARAAAPHLSVRAAPSDGEAAGRKAAGREDWTAASMDAAMGAARDFLDYVEEAPRRLSLMCFLGGLAIMVNGLLGVLDVFQVFDHMIYYVVNLYQVFFGLVTCITELHPDVSPDMYASFFKLQKFMHEWAKGLTTLWGRGLFHLFQGTLAMLSSGDLGVLIGLYMMVIRVHLAALQAARARAPQEDYIQIVG
eukprot:CAMPEP_0115577120 /NCGR_PEP_ID=MMETSP0272-20121206/2908_1 /TAXON_ID=71861 /ORGANISM="Scrippsiella trochoidea, Strain CCMP3099" /LENGTH=341 /DNA_ID=CAMNT_0003011921 /DNA_START=46 /DNA_END=1072 /DNA_ORIENTATION=-